MLVKFSSQLINTITTLIMFKSGICNGLLQQSYRTIFNPAALCRFASTKAPARNVVKKPETRKTYLVDKYTGILRQNPIILAVHNNTLLKSENNTIRSQILKAGGRLIVTRSNLFKVALRGLQHKDPASKAANRKHKSTKHPLSNLFYGPTSVIVFPELNPKAVDDVVRILDKSGEKLVLLGGMVDGQSLNRTKIDEFKQLPTLEQLRSELAGVLSVLGGAGLVQTLEAPSKMLYLTMDERRKQIENE